MDLWAVPYPGILRGQAIGRWRNPRFLRYRALVIGWECRFRLGLFLISDSAFHSSEDSSSLPPNPDTLTSQNHCEQNKDSDTSIQKCTEHLAMSSDGAQGKRDGLACHPTGKEPSPTISGVVEPASRSSPMRPSPRQQPRIPSSERDVILLHEPSPDSCPLAYAQFLLVGLCNVWKATESFRGRGFALSRLSGIVSFLHMATRRRY
jgi:hypothetical protein